VTLEVKWERCKMKLKNILENQKSNLRDYLQSVSEKFKYTSTEGAYVNGKFGVERGYGKAVSLNQLQAHKTSLLKGQKKERGTRILAEVLREAKRRGIDYYTFNAPSDAARALHKRFEREGILKSYLTYKDIGGVTDNIAVYKIDSKTPVKDLERDYDLPKI